jgi:prepilin peptidase CpaA
MSLILRILGCCALVALASFDLRYRRLPTKLVAAVACLYLVDAIAARDSFTLILNHVGMAAGAIVVGFVLFALRCIGGGDVKMAAAVLMWTGTALALPVLVVIAIMGLPVAALSWMSERTRCRTEAQREGTPGARDSLMHRFAAQWSSRRGVPYGVALAFGGCAALLLPVVFHLPRF